MLKFGRNNRGVGSSIELGNDKVKEKIQYYSHWNLKATSNQRYHTKKRQRRTTSKILSGLVGMDTKCVKA